MFYHFCHEALVYMKFKIIVVTTWGSLTEHYENELYAFITHVRKCRLMLSVYVCASVP